MRYVFAVTLSFFFLSGLCTPSHAEDDFDTALAKGAWALQFAIGQDFTLSNFEGSTIAVKRFTGDRVAWSLGFSGEFQARTTDDVRSDDQVPQDAVLEDEPTNWSVDLALVRLKYAEPSGRMHVHWGVGPTFGLSRSDRPQSRLTYVVVGSETFEQRTELRSESESWSVGGVAVLGAEWFAARSISLHADYRLVLTYSSQELATESKVDREDGHSRTTRQVAETETWRLAGSSVRFGLSAYF